MHAGAPAQLRRLAGQIPEDGVLAVGGGIEGEAMHPLDFSPGPGRPLRDLLSPKAIKADLDRLTALQQDDGGWVVDFKSHSAAGALEWRGYRDRSPRQDPSPWTRRPPPGPC